MTAQIAELLRSAVGCIRARSAFYDAPLQSIAAHGIAAVDRDGIGVAVVVARNGRVPALTAALKKRFNVTLPSGPTRTVSGDLAFAGVGPGKWLATLESGRDALLHTLEGVTNGSASVTDQSDGYAALRMTGPNVRNALAKIVSIDLHPRAFAPGDVASTLPYGAVLWRLQDGASHLPEFEIAVSRSLADEFWYALRSSAAGSG